MPFPNAAGSGTSGRTAPWWIVNRPSGARGGPPVEMPVQSNNRPQNTLLGPFPSQRAATNALNKQRDRTPPLPNPAKIVQGWFGGLGGMIGSGIEAGFIQSIKDLWDVILGPLEVLVGFAIVIITLTIYFKDDLASLVGMIGMAAAA